MIGNPTLHGGGVPEPVAIAHRAPTDGRRRGPPGAPPAATTGAPPAATTSAATRGDDLAPYTVEAGCSEFLGMLATSRTGGVAEASA